MKGQHVLVYSKTSHHTNDVIVFSINFHGCLVGNFKRWKKFKARGSYTHTSLSQPWKCSQGYCRKAQTAGTNFKFRYKCGALKLSHICLADDLMVFLKVDIHSVEVVQKALENYSIFSGLRANSTNSEVFIMANSPNLKLEILNML